MLKYYFILLILVITTAATAQKKVIHQDLLWTRYNLKVQLNDNVNITQELEERTYWFPWRGHQFLARTLVHKKLGNNWSATAGLAFLRVSPPNEPRASIADNKLEISPMLGATNTQTLSSKFSINHRYWSEFRFIEKSEKGYQFNNIRFRYQFQIKYIISDKFETYAFEEILINAGKKIGGNVFDHNRFGGGIKYKPSKALSIDLVYFNWFQETATAEQFYSRDIMRFTLSQNLSLKGN